MLRYLKLALALFRYSLSREMIFKGNFILWVFVEFGWFGLQLALVQVIFAHVNEIAGWTKYEMIVLIGTSHMVQQIFQFVFMINCMELPENIRTGKLDFLLLQPVNSQFMISLRKFDPGALVNATIGVGFIMYAAYHLHLHPTFSQTTLFFVLLLNGVAIHYALMLSIVTVSFWIVRAQGLVYGYYNLFQITRIPRQAFHGVARMLFSYFLPMLIVANFPASALIRNLSASGSLWVFALSLALITAATMWFRFGLRFYTSASS
jgi:ABC-2 type transport system permease protein